MVAHRLSESRNGFAAPSVGFAHLVGGRLQFKIQYIQALVMCSKVVTVVAFYDVVNNFYFLKSF